MTSYTINRSFVMENEQSQETQIHRAELCVKADYANLQPVLKLIGQPDMFKFKIYDFADNKYHDLRDYFIDDHHTQFLIPAHLLTADIALMKFIPDSSQTTSQKSSSQSASQASSNKKQRSKERTIAQVIEIVKQWRQIHTNNGNGKKVNLQQSAEMIGISKKSLDDYYYQLRLGEKYDFDFNSHLDDKVGVLRTFIKDTKSYKADTRSKVQKHPKKLKIIEQDLPQAIKKSSKSNKKSKSSRSQGSEQQQAEAREYENDYLAEQDDSSKKQISSIQNQFYNEFEFMVEEPPDPFLNFECDFKKKSYDDFSNELFF